MVQVEQLAARHVIGALSFTSLLYLNAKFGSFHSQDHGRILSTQALGIGMCIGAGTSFHSIHLLHL
jgi:hypothetical protein